MFTPDQYQLLDFGHGRRLERFGPLRLDRPCPAVEELSKTDPSLWERVDARFVRIEKDQGQWESEGELPPRWTISHGQVSFELKRTEFGHLGLFPEQAANWDWIVRQLGECSEPIRVLNLFAYTGGSTLAAAGAGAEVVHVDAARNVVAWARRNAELSGMREAPIRWIAEDALKFVRRELARGNKYDAVILDPPSYGHGPRGEVWRLAKDLPRLLEMCAELTAGRRRFALVTCHTPKFGPAQLAQSVSEAFGSGCITADAMTIIANNGRELPSGVMVCWRAES